MAVVAPEAMVELEVCSCIERSATRTRKYLVKNDPCDVAVVRAVDQGENVDEVEAAGNTALHNAAYEGWIEGAELLLSLGAKIDASNNAGDRPWHWARNMGHDDMMSMLEQNGASTEQGKVLVSEHIPKVKDFFQKECWRHHPKPYADYMELKKRQDEELAASRKKLIPGLA